MTQETRIKLGRLWKNFPTDELREQHASYEQHYLENKEVIDMAEEVVEAKTETEEAPAETPKEEDEEE